MWHLLLLRLPRGRPAPRPRVATSRVSGLRATRRDGSGVNDGPYGCYPQYQGFAGSRIIGAAVNDDAAPGEPEEGTPKLKPRADTFDGPAL